MENLILKYAPDTWDKSELNVSRIFPIHPTSNEYKKIYKELEVHVNHKYGYPITSIKRYQNLYDYGQLLIREQLKVNLFHGIKKFYRVRRYITINNQFLDNALEFNVDHRRCGLRALEFRNKVTVDLRETLLVIQVVTDSTEAATIRPENSSEYFIEYIINYRD